SDAESADEGRQPELQLELQQREAEIGAEHEEGAVRQVGDAHQAENQRKARRQQEQQAAEGHAVERLDDPELPLHLRSAFPPLSPFADWTSGELGVLTRPKWEEGAHRVRGRVV